MILHVVVFRWKPGIAADDVERVGHALDYLVSQIPEVLSMERGPDLRFRDSNEDYLLTLRFADEAGWHAYQGHPSHKAFVRDVVGPLQAQRVAIQIII